MKRTFCNILLLVSILSISSRGYSQCTTDVPTAERDALIALYNATGGANWTNNTNWNTSACVSDWYGVTVENGNVVQIILPSNNLSGSIPTELGNFPLLNKCELYTNNLIGDIPSSIGNLINLEWLSLSENQLVSIPTSIENLINLEVLYISDNLLAGAIPSELGTLPELVELSLHANQLTGSIPDSFVNSGLFYLYLNDNELSGDFPSLSTLSNLAGFRFNNNKFVFKDFESEHPAFNTNLTIYAYSPQAKIDQVETPIVEEGTSYTLTTSLSSPNNSYQWYKDGVAIPGATNKDYTINSVASTDAGVYHVIATNSIVTGLTLERNTITLATTTNTCGVSQTERDALMALYNATDGANWTNNTNWGTSVPVCDWYGVTVANGSVTRLILNNNQLSGTIPSQLEDLTNLIELNLSNNQLFGSIPSEIGGLLNLTHLYLFDNQLSGIIPNELGNLTSLVHLYLYVNQLTGNIPSELGNLTNLSRLRLTSNQFTGSIPSSLSNLTSLIILELANNNLTGGIPSELGTLNNLEQLYLYNNQLTGSIPNTFETLPNLTRLRIYSNQLSGAIPSGLSLINSMNQFRFQLNNFIFRDFENEFTTYVSNIDSFIYAPQAKVDQVETPIVTEGTSYTFTTSLVSTNNSYQWYKDGVAIPGATSKDYTINPVALTDAGVYHMLATNSIVTGLTLERHTITLTVNPPPVNNNIFCLSTWENYPLITDLTPSGSNVLWYAAETGGIAFNDTDEIREEAENPGGVSYWWDDTTDAISTRTEATVIIYLGPEGDTEQAFSIYGPAPTISDIDVVNNGEPVFWYDSSTSNTALSTNTVLVDGQTYYASSYTDTEDGNSCRLPVAITIGVIPPKGDPIQFLCEGSELSDIVIELEDGLSAVWYNSSEGGTSLSDSTLILDGNTYYVAQLDTNNGEESPKRLAVLVNILPLNTLVINETTQTFNLNASPKVEDLLASGYDVVWYSQPTGGNQYGGATPLENGQYYAEQTETDGQCPEGNRVEVTVILVDEPVDPLLGCELFRPDLKKHYVIDAWLNERDVMTETISEISFNGSPESELFIDLLNHLKNRLLSEDEQLHDIPAEYEPVFSSGEAPRDLSPLMAFIDGLAATEKKLIVYDFETIDDAYGRAIGFSFYLNAAKDRQIIYKTPNIVRNGVKETGDLNRYPLLDNIGNTSDEFLKFTKVEVVTPTGEFEIYADFKQVIEPAHEVSQKSTFSNSNIVKQTSTNFKYNEVAYQSVSSYNQAVIEVSFVDVDNVLIGAPIPLLPQSKIIDKWQKVATDFIIPDNAGKMIISLKNNDSNRIAYFDDLRILPFKGNMKTFVYHPENQRLMSELDENNFATYYEYDLEGGLIRVKKETEEGIYTIQETRSGTIKKTN
ncbi:leucine-rich repeat domain-containing protein [Flavivirga algicola]|uniref:Ig-like domain-containing protein n=1 Tax=Flavivirga algicola TaxID=2729136 RepID=A0ABX1RQY1_9FLAO|nr:leucine-rich repeat domain-containing protein [Flavivirga algicola]NMH85961.1 hypothetical protein [Flavivirga algicola]